MGKHNNTGKLGENIAEKYLTKEGHIILDKNWHFGKEELDIIARKDDIIIFVEVKTRESNAFGEPEEFVTRKKQKHIIRAANAYIEKKNLEMKVRFDVIAVLLDKEKHSIHHIEDAFYPVA